MINNLVLKLKRLLGTRLMGDLFKVILAYKFKNDNYFCLTMYYSKKSSKI